MLPSHRFQCRLFSPNESFDQVARLRWPTGDHEKTMTRFCLYLLLALAMRAAAHSKGEDLVNNGSTVSSVQPQYSLLLLPLYPALLLLLRSCYSPAFLHLADGQCHLLQRHYFL